MAPRLLAGAAVLLLAACGEQMGPDASRVQVAAAAGERQFAQAGAMLDQPLQVVVTDAATGKPAKDVEVRWRVVLGAGTPTPTTATTDALGVASTRLRLGEGSAGSTVRVEATTSGNIGEPAIFEAHLVGQPVIASVTPVTIAPGATVTITGQGFLAEPADNAVLFGGIRGTVTAALPDRLVVTAPQCLQNRTVALRVQLGQVASAPRSVETIAPAAGELSLAPGQVMRLTAADVECVRFGGDAPGALYLAVPQNAADVLALPVSYELIGTVGSGIATSLDLGSSLDQSAPRDRELMLRLRERALFDGAGDRARLLLPQAAERQQPPRIGDRRQFNVLDSEQKSERVTAEVRAISGRALMYVDVDAPANGFTEQDLRNFGALFDDPIHPAVIAVFGQPTDVDGNGSIIILFTPRVNALTERGEDGFIAGYFYGCDLVTAVRCADTNRAEIFYSMVPDPEGSFGDRRTKNDVLRTVPGILAHEFQHMIHFGQKDALDALWLSEGLAHAAEELVGRVFLDRGDAVSAEQFRLPNFNRGHRYLLNTTSISLIADDSPGTLELRGAAWLFVEYIASHFGDHDLLRRLTRAPRSGIANIIAETGESWSRLVSDFAVALWADGAPDLAAVSVDARFTFPDLDLRDELGRFQGGFALRPATTSFQDFVATGTLASSAHTYVLLQAPATRPLPFSLSFTGIRGGTLPLTARPQLTLLRIR